MTLAPRVYRLVLLMLAFVVTAGSAWAEVTGVQIRTTSDALGGKAFGSVGPYELLKGTISFAIDPGIFLNGVIMA